MATVNMLEAKSNLSRLVEAVESGKEAEIIIARNGRPAARLVPVVPARASFQRIGVAKGESPCLTISSNLTRKWMQRSKPCSTARRILWRKTSRIETAA